MIVKATFLFLLGTTLTSGQYWPRLAPFEIARSSGCPSGPELAPLICKFMQPNIGLQFKPQLIEPSTYIAPLVVEKCDTPKLEMEIELPPPTEEMKPLVIPQPPELPPMTIPKFPVPVIIEEPAAPPREPYESVDIPAMPYSNIPAAPELPKFIMPELPTRVIEPELPIPAAPYMEEPVPEPVPAYVEPLAPLPAAPELPAFVMPELPIQVVEEKLPVPAAPYFEEYYKAPALLPAAPEIPAFIMPELPMRIMEAMPAAPCLEDEKTSAPIPAYAEPLAPLPAAPELPAFVMPELPIQVVEEKLPEPAAPYFEEKLIPAPIPAYFEPANLPAAPLLPAFTMPELPEQNIEKELPISAAMYFANERISFVPTYRQPFPEWNSNMVEYEPVAVPQLPELPAFAMPEPNPAFEGPIPAAPELPLAPIPEFPVRVEISSMPMVIDERFPEPCKDERVAEVEYNTVEYRPMAIPQAPELAAFVMPELPVRVAEQEFPVPAVPYFEGEPAPIIPVPEYIEPLAPIPAAPELTPASLPKLPLRVEIPSAPAFIAEPEPYLPEEKAPALFTIPQAPILPELTMPELPVNIAIEDPAPCEPSIAMPSPFYEKLFPSHLAIYNEKAKATPNILLPGQPMDFGAYPTPCVYTRNLVTKHVLPYIASDKFEIKPASFLPCS